MGVEYLVDSILPKEIKDYKVGDKVGLNGQYFKAFGKMPRRKKVEVTVIGSFLDYDTSRRIVVVPEETIFKSRATAVLSDGTHHEGIWILEPDQRDWLSCLDSPDEDDDPMWLLKTLW